MININLLPWREEKRQKNKQRFMIENIVCSLLVIIVAVFIHLSYSKKINWQNNINTSLENEIRQLNNNIQKLKDSSTLKTTLEKQINTLHQLYHARYQTITLLKEITVHTPEGIFLDEMERKGDKITITGRANSLLPITKLIKQIGESGEVMQPILNNVSTIPQKDGTKITRFGLIIHLKPYQPIYQQGNQ